MSLFSGAAILSSSMSSMNPTGPSTVDTTSNMAAPKAPATKQNAKMHRRSRTGCFTCRLRRKKCDEGKPTCRACKHLGLRCEYKRPMWWSNNEQRRQQKETIKTIIRRTKVSEKTAQVMSMGGETPPGLSYSVPTSDAYSDTLDRTRAASEDSQFSLEYDFSRGAAGFDALHGLQPQVQQPYYGPPHPAFAPYEVDVKTERQTFVNDVPTRRDSSMSTFSTFHPPSLPTPHAPPPSVPGGDCIYDEAYDVRTVSAGIVDPNSDVGYFDMAHAQPTTMRQTVIQVEECDQRLLDHFINNVLRLIFPVLEVNRHGLARSEVVLPALETNRCYLHCCLSISALHMKATQALQGEQIDNDIMRHRYATISELCNALNRDADHVQILEATLGMIFFQCTVGRPDDCLPDIPWHQHFQAASSLVHKLELPRALTDLTGAGHPEPPFNMTLTSWIDILGATMMGRAPHFADAYRDKHLSSSSSGLCELMGCDDRIMYLISEMACLEALKKDGMDDIQLCEHVHALADSLGLTEPGPGGIASPYSSSGAIRPRQLARNMSAVFRFAARIYLCSLVPCFSHDQLNIVTLVNQLTETLGYIPAGPDGFDRSLVWPYLIAGSVALRGSSFRRVFQDRIRLLGEHAEFGSFGRMVRLLQEVWRQADEQRRDVHWRDVMQQRGWDDLLI